MSALRCTIGMSFHNIQAAAKQLRKPDLYTSSCASFLGADFTAGADPGEVKWVNFHPPFSEAPSLIFFSYPSNIEIIFDFSDIITKIHPPFQNPGSALVLFKVTIYSEHSQRTWMIF